MKHFIIPALFTMVSITACKQSISDVSLIVYYSQTGTTKALAEEFHKNIPDADLIELVCQTPYPDTYEGTIEESREECMKGLPRPLINPSIKLDRYSTIYIGYPIWYGTYAPPITAFIRQNDLSGKDVVLFCTYGSGGKKSSRAKFKEACPDANVVDVFGIASNRIDAMTEEVPAFLANLGNARKGLVGAYGEYRELENSDIEVFNNAMEHYEYSTIVPKRVKTQVVAGINYIFDCETISSDGNVGKCEVHIFKPLQGDPVLKSVEM